MRIIKLLAKKLAIAGVISAVVISSCTDKTDQIGANLVPNGPLKDMDMVDTISINAYSVEADTILTSGKDENLIGFLNDPIFGKVVSSTYAQIIPDVLSFKGFDGYVLDSVVFSLKYSGSYYGDTLTEQNLGIYEITEGFDRYAYHYSHEEYQYNPIPIVSRTYLPTPLTTDTTLSVRPTLEVRMKIPNDHPFVNNIWNLDSAAIYMDTVAQVDMDKFINLVKGIYIKSDPIAGETGALIGFNMTSADTKITFYTKEVDNESNLREFDFQIISGYSSWFNNINHLEFEGAEDSFLDQILNENKESAKDKLYLQNMAGSTVYLDFPYLKNLNEFGNVIVNKAELVLSYEDDSEADELNINQPQNLSIGIRHTNDTTTVVPDYYQGVSFLGGSIDTTNKEYRFRLTKYVQEVLQDKDVNELGLVLFSGSDISGYNRLVFIGFDPADPNLFNKRFRLEVTYSIID